MVMQPLKETDATAPDENGQIAYNSLADDDSGQEVTGAEVGDTVGMTPEAFEATHTPVAAMDEPEPEATSFWGRVASVFSGHHGNSESSEPGVVNPDTVAQGGTTDAVPTGSGVPTPQTATATTTATGATGSANAANTAHGTTINTNGVDNAAAGNAESRTPGANNVNVVNPDAVTNGSGSVKPASTPAGAPVANGTATSKPINAANVTVTGASASGKTVTEEGPAPTTTPVSPDSSDFAANDSTVSVESPTDSAPSEEFAGPAEQTTSYGSADAEFGGSNTPSDIGVVNENAGSTDSETQFANDSSAAVQTHTPASQADNAATNDNVSDDASVDYAEPPANADNASGGSAAPVVQHTDNEPAVGESDDSDTSSGYVGGTEDVGSADVDASPMDGDSATVETHAPASYADRTVDTDDEATGNAGPDYAEPPANADNASGGSAAPVVQHMDNEPAVGESG